MNMNLYLQRLADEIARRDAVEVEQSNETKALISELQRLKFLSAAS